MSTRVLVIVPTYDERDSLPVTVSRLRAAVPEADVLVADDASPDGTGEIADALAAGDRAVHVLHRPGKEGLGPAYLAGFRWGLERCYEVLVEMDADGSHRPEQLPGLLTAVRRGADLAIGSRWVPGGAVHNWPLSRQALSRGANIYVDTMLGLRVHDSTAGFRAFRAELLHQIVERGIASQGYCFQVDMTRRTRRTEAVIVEIPIDFDERVRGESKMSGHIVREALLRVTGWGLAHRGRQLSALLRRPGALLRRLGARGGADGILGTTNGRRRQ